ncbi:MAG: hypothetical protein Q9208_001259 [Pyrenodesmia sp. 3 TL-2023]
MSNFVYVALYPLLLLFSFPLIIFAFLTTTAAITTLLFRVLLVYADLAAVLIKDQISYHQSSNSTLSLTQGTQQSPRRSSTRSSSGDQHAFGGSRTPKSVESSGLGIYSAGSMQRDFEGVGGWRIPNTEGEDILWTSMNARLELPAFGEGPHRHHRRAITSSGTPMSTHTRASEFQNVGTPVTPRALGTTSPQEYFVNQHASESTTALGTGYR